MRNKFKEIDIKNRAYYFFDDMINTKSLKRSRQIKIHAKVFLFIALDT